MTSKTRKPAGPKPQPVNDRGEWRPFYEVLWDDPDFRALPAEARWTWATLKGRCGACGIRIIPALDHALSVWTGYGMETLSKALGILRDRQRIDIEADLVWVVRGIDFEPTLYPSNPLHRKFVANTLNALPRLDIVARFARANAHWLEGTGYRVTKPFLNPTPTPTPTPTPITTPKEAAAAWDGIELTPEAREQLNAFARAHDRPTAFRLMVRALGPGGTYERASWDELSRALLNYAGSEITGVPGQKVLIRFIDDVKRTPVVEDGRSDLDRLADELRGQQRPA